MSGVSSFSLNPRTRRTTVLRRCWLIFRRYDDAASRLAVGGYAEAIAPLQLPPLALERKYFSTGRFTPLVGEYPLKNGILYGFCLILRRPLPHQGVTRKGPQIDPGMFPVIPLQTNG